MHRTINKRTPLYLQAMLNVYSLAYIQPYQDPCLPLYSIFEFPIGLSLHNFSSENQNLLFFHTMISIAIEYLQL